MIPKSHHRQQPRHAGHGTHLPTVTGNAPTVNVSFYAGGSLLGTSALNGAFQATFTTSSLAIGTHEITTRYAGNANNATSTSAPLPIEIASILPVIPANLIAQSNNNQVRLLQERLRGVEKRARAKPISCIIDKSWWGEFATGKVDISVIAFQGIKKNIKRANFSLWIQEMKVPPLGN